MLPILSRPQCVSVTDQERIRQSWLFLDRFYNYYCDIIMGAMASQITSLTIVYSNVHSGADQRKHRSSALLAFVRGIHRWPVNSPHKWPVTRKMFPLDDVIINLLPLTLVISCEKKIMPIATIYYIFICIYIAWHAFYNFAWPPLSATYLHHCSPRRNHGCRPDLWGRNNLGVWLLKLLTQPIDLGEDSFFFYQNEIYCAKR